MPLSPSATAVITTVIGVLMVLLGVTVLAGATSFSIIPAYRGMPRRYLGTATVALGCCFALIGWAAAVQGSTRVVLLIGFGVALAVSVISGWVGQRRPPDLD